MPKQQTVKNNPFFEKHLEYIKKLNREVEDLLRQNKQS